MCSPFERGQGAIDDFKEIRRRRVAEIMRYFVQDVYLLEYILTHRASSFIKLFDIAADVCL